MKLLVLLFTPLLPSLVQCAFTVRLGSGEAVYKLHEDEDPESAKLRSGSQGFVRFATVISSPQDCRFKGGDEVALKIGFPGEAMSMLYEQSVHDYIRTKARNGGIDGVVKVEHYLGESSDIGNDPHLMYPEGVEKQAKYSILIMEPLGKDLETCRKAGEVVPEARILIFLDSLNRILDALNGIDVTYRDVKLGNIVLYKNNNLNDGICLVDFGHANVVGFPTTNFFGTLLYRSPGQMTLNRSATNGDTKISGVYAMVYLRTSYLPWNVYAEEYFTQHQKHNLHLQRITQLKHKFNLYPLAVEDYAHYSLSEDFKTKIKETIQAAMFLETETRLIRQKYDEFTAMILATGK